MWNYGEEGWDVSEPGARDRRTMIWVLALLAALLLVGAAAVYYGRVGSTAQPGDVQERAGTVEGAATAVAPTSLPDTGLEAGAGRGQEKPVSADRAGRGLAVGLQPGEAWSPGGDVVLNEDFNSETWPWERWTRIQDGDFQEAVVDTVNGRLRLRAATIGTRADTVKHLGIRTNEPVVDLGHRTEIEAEIDWNDQANGCYLRASLYLCPTKTDGTAKKEADWLKLV